MSVPGLSRPPLAAMPTLVPAADVVALVPVPQIASPLPIIAPPAEIAVEVVDEAAGLAALRAEWNELLAASAADELFLTWEWLATWWRHLGGGRRPAIFAVREAGRLVGLAPFARSRSAPATLRFLGSGVVGSDYLDLIARRGGEAAAVAAVAERLDRERPILDLVQVRSRSAVAALAGELERRGWTRVERATHLCPLIDLDGLGWDEFVASLGPSHRANLRRRIRQLERAPGFAFRSASTPEEVERGFDALVRLHRLRWRGGSDALGDREVVDFHREFCRLSLERGWLRLHLLELEGRPVAALYGLRYRDRFLFYQAGFDPAFAQRSVGLVCFALSIRAAIAEGAKQYDLLHGAEAYKFLWARRCRSLSRFELYPPTPGAGLKRWFRHGVGLCKESLRGIAQAARGPAPAGGAYAMSEGEAES
jgi:CelD/BcsL family acetyltransferase involved in cellulose biosynthesis